MKTKPSVILRYLVGRAGLLVALGVLGLAAGGVYGAMKTPTYRTSAHVVVTGEPGEPFAAVNFAQAYGRIATEGAVTDLAAKTLSGAAGLDRVTASTSPDAPVIEITATGDDATRTAAVANAVATALVTYAAERKAQTRVTLAVLAPAATPKSPSSPRPPLEAAVGAAGGLLIGGLAVLAGVGRPRREHASAVPTMDPAHGPEPVAATVMVRGASEPVALPIAGRRPSLDGTDEPQRAIEWYGGGAVAEFLTPEADGPARLSVPIPPPAGSDRIVGRAVVIYRESS